MLRPSDTDATAQAMSRALSSPLRLRVLRLCAFEARTNKELAELLGVNPGTMLHHVRTLVQTGFLAAQPDRAGTQGAREVPYRATGLSWNTSMPEGSPVLVETFLQQIEGLAAGRARRHVARPQAERASPRRSSRSGCTELVNEFKERGPGRRRRDLLAVHGAARRPQPAVGATPDRLMSHFGRFRRPGGGSTGTWALPGLREAAQGGQRTLLAFGDAAQPGHGRRVGAAPALLAWPHGDRDRRPVRRTRRRARFARAAAARLRGCARVRRPDPHGSVPPRQRPREGDARDARAPAPCW